MQIINFLKERLKDILATYKEMQISGDLIKNILIIPGIYILGTIILIIRNKFLGFPFYTLDFVRLTLLVVYFIISYLTYLIIEYVLLNGKRNRYLIIFLFIIPITYICVFELDIIMSLFSFLLYPIVMYFLYKKEKKPLLNEILVIFFYMTILLGIPISMGGFKGKTVYFYDDALNTKTEYIFYGIENGMYQFADKNNIYLIPIDKGYIEYKR